MSLCQDRQIKGFLLFLTLFALLFVGTATVLTIYQVNGAEALWLKHDEAVSSSLLEQSVPKEVIAVAFTNTDISEDGRSLLAAAGLGKQSESSMRPYFNQFQRSAFCTMLCTVLFFLFVLAVGIFVFFWKRKRLYQQADKILLNYINGDYSCHIPQNYEGAIYQVFSSVEQLATMIHEILETSKINMETTQEDSTKCNLSDLISNVCEPYELIAATHGINLQLDIPQEYRIMIPQKQFSRAFSNIIANAVTYTPNEGSVFVCLKEHTLTVENECIPIDKQQLAHIFEPFYRPDFSRNSDSGGNGLGLYIVSTIFSSLHISYEFLPTESQKGMCFSILLPKAL